MKRPKIATAVLTSWDRKLTKAPELRQVSATYKATTGCGGCPLQGGPCYAWRGRVGIHARRLDEEAERIGASSRETTKAEADAVRMLPTDGRPLRLQVVGEAASTDEARELAGAVDELKARGGGPTWTYSHHWRTIRREAWSSISILASCETVGDVRTATRRGYAAALVVAEWGDARELAAAGFKPMPCPEEIGTKPDCESCRLCMDADGLAERGEVIVFKARDGTRKHLLPVLAELNRGRG